MLGTEWCDAVRIRRSKLTTSAVGALIPILARTLEEKRFLIM